MSGLGVWKYRFLRRLSRLVVETAAAVTVRRMPPFVGAAAIVIRDGQVLMIRDTAIGMPALPGGHLRWNESVEAGLTREVFEETGYHVRPLRTVGIFDSGTELADRGIIRVIMEAEITGGSERSSAEGAVVWQAIDLATAGDFRDAGILRQWRASSES